MICVINLDACVVAGEDGVEVAAGERQARHEGQRVVLARQPVTRPVGVVACTHTHTHLYIYMYIYRRRHLQDEPRAAVRVYVFIYLHIYICL